ncbi:MAG: hypothetical protein QG608_3097 [Actinomycetota bacterium]|nr:hypothetical protein [Actinomycetota bacterium]
MTGTYPGSGVDPWAVLRATPTALVQTDAEGRVVVWNPAAERLFGYTVQEILGEPDPLSPQDQVAVFERLASPGTTDRLPQQDPQRDPPERSHRQCLRKDGTAVEVEICVVPVRGAEDEIVGVLTSYDDARPLDPDHETHLERGHRQEAIAMLGQQALSTVDLQELLERAIRLVSDYLDLPVVCLALTDRRSEELRYTATFGWRCPPACAVPPESLAQQVVDRGEVRVLPRITDRQASIDGIVGAPPVHSCAGVPLGGERRLFGAITAYARQPAAFGEEEMHFLKTVANIVAAATGRHEAESQIRYRAFHDALTDLPNRELLHERLGHCLRSDPHSRLRTALLLIDLDGFKDVNDSQGHQVGDQVLRQVADRVRRRLRNSDTVARLGGDEFAVVLDRMQDNNQVVMIAQELADLLREPFDSPGGQISLSGSIGIAVSPDHGSDTHVLLQRADLAMYRAKRERTEVEFFDPGFDETAGSRLWMVKDLRAAIEGNQLGVAFQPVIDLFTNNVASVEALARWHHPQRGPQPPLQFVGLAEQNGLIGGLTDLILRETLVQCGAWLEAGRSIPVAVNLSPALLSSTDYASYLIEKIIESGIPPWMIRFEVTESALASEAAVATLRRIHDFGTKISVDDFGTGWSSLGRLKQLPVDTVKIDRSFVTDMTADTKDTAIVRSVVALAQDLQLRTIAEGVETPQVAQALVRLGVQRAQGFLYSRPVTGSALSTWYDSWQLGRRRLPTPYADRTS